MADVKFSKEHEWITIDGDTGTVGITPYAQEQLGDVVYVELPETGKQFDKDAEVAVVESVKAASEIYTPVAGEIVAANGDLEDNPGTINSDPLAAGWIFKIKLSDPSQLDGLLDEAAYNDYIGDLD